MSATQTTPFERTVGTLMATAPLLASVILDRHSGYAIGTGLWGLFILSWIWSPKRASKAPEE